MQGSHDKIIIGIYDSKDEALIDYLNFVERQGREMWIDIVNW